MTRKLYVLLTIVLAVNGICLAESKTLLTSHVRESVISGRARPVSQLPATQTLRFDIVLALRHHPELNNFLRELYNPSSPSYHQYVTVHQFTERFGPGQEDYDALLLFAKASGFKMTGGSRDSMDVQFTASVASIEKAFHVTMRVYQHPTENRIFYSPDREPTVELPFQLWHISGLDNYSIPRPLFKHSNIRAKSNATTGSCPEQSFCGSDMRAAYYEGTALTGAGQNIGLLEYAGFDIADVNTYYENAGQTRTATVIGISTDGTSTNCLASEGCDDTEQTIDITQALGMAPGVTTAYLYVGSTDTALLGGMTSDTPLPLNLSSSWTWKPADPGTDDPYWEKMAAQGQSFFQASGDSGGYKNKAPWPSNSANVIAVGGTDLETTGPGGPWESETAWADGGGGWGTDVPIPSWQVAAAAQCAEEGGGCSQTYRNVPDVAANASISFYVCADQAGCTANEYGGTSFAAPMWAGYLALTNQQAAASGDQPAGFINLSIYPLNLSNGDADFHDITSGSNGFHCVTGYNLCGGWGSPNSDSLINALAPSGGSGPVVSLSPSSLKWGQVVVGDGGAAKKVVLTNTGSATLNLTAIAASGDFAIVPVKATKKITPCVNGGTVAAGASCEIKVSFTPLQSGTLTGDVTFTDNASNSPQQIALTGTGKK